MTWMRIGAAAFAAVAAIAVANTALAAPGTCKDDCNSAHVKCLDAGKSDGAVCLPQWQQCRTACYGAIKQTAAVQSVKLAPGPTAKLDKH
jgi:hypothetical protein